MILNGFKIAVLVLVIAFILFFNKLMISIHHFLEITSPIEAKILVVEGWLTSFDYTLPEVVKEYQSRSYDYIVTNSITRGGTKSQAEQCAEKLHHLGIDSKKIISVTAPPLTQYKTYGAALAFRDWLKANHPEVRSINVFTGGTHGRKSHFLFRKALDDYCDVGIISSPLHHTPMGKWWRTRRGTIGTFTYFAGYIYTFLKPTWPEDLETLSHENIL